MSDDNASHPSPPEGERAYWLDQPENVNLLIKILIVVAVGVTLADFGYHKHGHFGFQEWFAFDAVFGFIAYVGLVNTAKLFRKLVMRDEDYYEAAAGAYEPTDEESVDD